MTYLCWLDFMDWARAEPHAKPPGTDMGPDAPAVPTLSDHYPSILYPQTLFNPNKTVVKMFLVTYDFQDMPANHMTFLRHRIFLVPVGKEKGATVSCSEPPGTDPPRRVLCYLMHLR